ncbi:MAG: hypothetical protein HY785_08320 [Oscillatoriophycideae cyanobacterium NC_groundwater_1537_Pr4_S-0.65um_50_18]|nr:hypothetical protein [Oscillatoriophycideae cyanobacterium NC_groundwater_1537_Pr4_S-0.65um_50_18]
MLPLALEKPITSAEPVEASFDTEFDTEIDFTNTLLNKPAPTQPLLPLEMGETVPFNQIGRSPRISSP